MSNSRTGSDSCDHRNIRKVAKAAKTRYQIRFPRNRNIRSVLETMFLLEDQGQGEGGFGVREAFSSLNPHHEMKWVEWRFGKREIWKVKRSKECEEQMRRKEMSLVLSPDATKQLIPHRITTPTSHARLSVG